jgi:hypothetical protein
MFELWRQRPKIDYVVSKLEAENSNVRGLEALLRSAFEAGWVGGYSKAVSVPPRSFNH